MMGSKKEETQANEEDAARMSIVFRLQPSSLVSKDIHVVRVLGQYDERRCYVGGSSVG